MKLLAIDGGGVRGLLPLYLLREFEERSGQTTLSLFDAFAGTSTGGLIAVGLTAGCSVAELIDFYEQRAHEIFPSFRRRIWEALFRRLRYGLSAPRYDSAALLDGVIDLVAHRKFRDLLKPTFVPTYDLTNGNLTLFASTNAPETLTAVDVCMATSAAPGFLPGWSMTSLAGLRRTFVDGGVAANSPAALVAAHLLRTHDEVPIIVSLGTGIPRAPQYDAHTWGVAQWAPHYLDLFGDGNQDAAHDICKTLVMPDHYFRFQRVMRCRYAFDDAREHTLTSLAGEAATMIAEQSLSIDLALQALLSAKG